LAGKAGCGGASAMAAVSVVGAAKARGANSCVPGGVAAVLTPGALTGGRADVALRACWAAMMVLSALTCMPCRPGETGKIFRHEGCQRLNGLAERYCARLRHNDHGLDKNSSVKGQSGKVSSAPVIFGGGGKRQ